MGQLVTLDAERVIEEAADAAAYCDQGVEADAIMRRAREVVKVIEMLPEGWRVDRDELRRRLDGALTGYEFAVYDDAGKLRATCVRDRRSRDGEQGIYPGSITHGDDADGARAKGVAFLLAAFDYEAHDRTERAAA